jgi:RimJ/RimL family protein N-acetyltransferase
VRCVVIELGVPAEGVTPALLLRRWRAADMPGLVAEMRREYPSRGIQSHPSAEVPGPGRWSGPRNEQEAALWLSGQNQGWAAGDWLTFAVTDASQGCAIGQVGLKNRDGGRIGTGDRGEIGYWTAPGARGRGVAPAAVRAVTRWALGSFAMDQLPFIMLVHDLDNPASCRVAAKSGYPFHQLSPANPPYWFTDGHIHVARR